MFALRSPQSEQLGSISLQRTRDMASEEGIKLLNNPVKQLDNSTNSN